MGEEVRGHDRRGGGGGMSRLNFGMLGFGDLCGSKGLVLGFELEAVW
jgi:hypothetical protein